MLRSSSLVTSAVAYLALPRSVSAEKNVLADERMPLAALVLRLLAFLGYPVCRRPAFSADAGAVRLQVEIVSAVRMPLRTVRNLLLPEPAALDSVGGVALTGADVQVGRVGARRVVAPVTGIFDAGLPTYQGSSAKVAEKPAVGPVLLSSEVEESVSAFISGASPEPAFGIFSTVDFGPENGLSFSVSHEAHSTPRAIPIGVIWK